MSMKILDILFTPLTESFALARKEFSASADIADVDATIKIFKANVPKVKDEQQKDINSWRKVGYEKFKQFVQQLEASPSNKQSKKTIKRDNSIILHDDSNLFIVAPLTSEASCHYGANTKWCTAAREDNRFDEYFNRNIVMIYVTFKPTGLKYAASVDEHDGSGIQCFDQKDVRISVDEFYNKTGVDENELQQFAATVRKDPRVHAEQGLMRDISDMTVEYDEHNTKILTDLLSDKSISKQVRTMATECLELAKFRERRDIDDILHSEKPSWSDFPKLWYVMNKKDSSAVLVKKIKQKIVSNASFAYAYAVHTQARYKDGEFAIAMNPKIATYYASEFGLTYDESARAFIED